MVFFFFYFRDLLPNDKPILHSILSGTATDLSPQKNVAVMTMMEEEIISLGQRKGFGGVLATNTSLLTQKLAETFLEYVTLVDYQINEYVVDGWRPFEKAPDHYKALVQFRKL